jgi:hypothetical protein
LPALHRALRAMDEGAHNEDRSAFREPLSVLDTGRSSRSSGALTTTDDIGAHLRPGNDNTVVLTATGKPDTSAVAIIHN